MGLFYVLLDTFLYCLKIFPTMYINFMMKNTKKCFYLFIYFWSPLVACNILVPQPQTEAMPLAVKVRSPNPWIAKEFLKKCLKILNNFHSMTRPWFRIPFSNKRSQGFWRNGWFSIVSHNMQKIKDENGICYKKTLTQLPHTHVWEYGEDP